MQSRFFSICTITAALVASCASAAAAAEFPVGFTRITVAGNTAMRGDAGNTLRVVVWYPATAGTPTSPLAVGSPQAPVFIEGQAAVDAPLTDAISRFPFVVVSHGTGGTAMDIAWLCAGLAGHGYIVASVTHPGDNALEPATVAGTSLWWQRADDLTHVIDGVLATPRFGSRIDPSRIGAAGFSMGGYTVLAIAGARGNPLALDAYCAHHRAAATCDGVATPNIPDIGEKARALAASDAAFLAADKANSRSHRDSRVRAVFSIAPALGPALIRESLASIDIPVAFVAGFADPILPVSDNIIPDALAVPNAQLTLLPAPVGHYTFLMNCAPAGMKELAPICGDSGPARLAVHQETLAIANAFFDRTLGQ